MPDFNLAEDPWLTVTLTDGSETVVSLREMFLRAHELADFTMPTPLGKAALYRVLAAMTYRITGLDDGDNFARRRNGIFDQGEFDRSAVDAYFDAWTHRFGLFDKDRPFLQDPLLDTECKKGPAGLNKIIWERPAGNNAAFFSPFSDANPGTADIRDGVDALLMCVYYGPSGQCATRTHGGSSFGNFGLAGPLRGSASYHPVADTIFATLLAHLVPANSFDASNTEGRPDLAEWEWGELPERIGQMPLPVGVVSAVAGPVSHAVLLIPTSDGLGVANAYYTWRYRTISQKASTGVDHYLSYRVPSKGQNKGLAEVRRGGDDQMMWRDAAAIMSMASAPDPTQFQPARVASHISTLPRAVLRSLRMTCYSHVSDRAQDKYWYEGHSPKRVMVSLSEDATEEERDYRSAVPQWVSQAEYESDKLEESLISARHFGSGRGRTLDLRKVVKEFQPEDHAWSRQVSDLFWSRAHAMFRTALAENAGGPAFANSVASYKEPLRNLSIALYLQVTSGVRDGRELAAVAWFQPNRIANVAAPTTTESEAL